MMTLNEVVAAVAKESKLTQEKARQIILATLQTITDTLATGDDMTITHLGRFKVHSYPSKSIPDPRGRGHQILVLPRKVVKFKPAIRFRKKIETRKGHLHEYGLAALPPEKIVTVKKNIAPDKKPEAKVIPLAMPTSVSSSVPHKPTAEAIPDHPEESKPATAKWLELFARVKERPVPKAPEEEKPVEKQTIAEVESSEKPLAAPKSIPFKDLSSVKVDKDVLNLLPEMFARRHKAVPIEANESQITVGMVDPENLEIIQLIKKSTGRDVVPILTSSEDIDRILNQYSGLEAEVASVIKDTTLNISQKVIAEAEHENVEMSGDDSPTARIVASLLRRAVREKASDVHIEPYEKAVVVRFRIDGVLRTRVKLPKEIQPAIISRLKILGNLKIDEHRLPQDGRFQLEIDRNKIDFRLSTLPVADGEKAVMRILDKAQGILSIEEIGVQGKGYDVLKSNVKKSYGMTLVTGPTGSGKTTTLYALLGQLMDVGINIITLENPIEYRIEGINQSQINPDIGYTFANGLRAIVRQDPDVIMVGEIRDKDTAEIAIQSALTGHIVLSTLHTNNASGAVPRLIDMGVEPFLISSSVNTIVAQRLARKLCSHCREKHQPTSKEIELIQTELANLPAEQLKTINLKKTTFYTSKGCNVCTHTGYQGRLGLFEVLDVNTKIENLILKSATDSQIQEAAVADGMVTMLQDGLLKAIAGLTSLEEVWRVTRD